MSVLPSQRLTVGELYVSMAIGLILFLMPNDINNAVGAEGLSEGLTALTAAVTTASFTLIIKRYEAVGAALLTHAVITIASFSFWAVNGFVTKSGTFWPTLSAYQLKTIFLVWTIPFLMMVILRLLIKGPRDTNDQRAGFVRFLSLSLRALMILYLFVIVFMQIVPKQPDMVNPRQISYMPLAKISECIANANSGGLLYVIWNSLILAPLTFSLLILNPKIKWWQLLIISLAFGLTIEILQFSLNTATVYTDDILMYLVGGVLGFLLKYLVDGIRRIVTGGKEKSILCLTAQPVLLFEDDTEEEEENTSSQEKKPETVIPEITVKAVIGFENEVKAVEETAPEELTEISAAEAKIQE